MKKTIYTKYSNDRSPRFNICTEISQDEIGRRYVIKRADSPESQNHIHNIIKWSDMLNQIFSDTRFIVNAGRKIEDGIEFEYLTGDNLEQVLCTYEKAQDQERVDAIWNRYITELTKIADQEFVMTEEFRQIFGEVSLPSGLKSCSVTDLDLIFNNIIVSEDKWHVMDYEWTFDFPIPINFVIYRAVFSHLIVMNQMAEYSDYSGNDEKREQLYQRFGITPQELIAYDRMERSFQKYVGGNNTTLGTLFAASGRSAVSVYDLLSLQANEYNKYNFQVYFDYGNGFSEDNSKVWNFQPEADGRIQFRIGVPGDVSKVRIDPGSAKCIIYEVSATGSIDGQEKSLVYEDNGYHLGNEVIVYTTDDPQMTFDLSGKNCSSIELCLYMNVSDQAVEEAILQEHKSRLRTEQRQQIEYEAVKVELKAMQVELEEALQREAQSREELFQMAYQLRLSQEQYSQVIQSGSWKITAPMRKVRRFAIRHCSNRYTRQFMRGVRSVQRDGVKVTWKKVLRWSRKKKNKNTLSVGAPIGPMAGETPIDSLTLLNQTNKKIAVQLHLYYVDLMEEFCGYLDHIPYDFDLYISCQENADVETIRERVSKIAHVKKVVVKGLPNRGRDVAPIFVWFAKELEKYDYMLHVHSKKSLYTGEEKVGWRQYSLDSIIGSEEVVQKVFGMFEKDEHVGLVYPDNHEDVPMLAYSWLANEGQGRQLLHELGIPFESGILHYPAGSFYWARVDAIRPLFDRRFIIEDFPEEAGQTDGTLAHVIERVIGLTAKHLGYESAIVDYREGVIRHNTSTKAFRPYFGMTKNNIHGLLSRYDVISFDVFDTLITRCVLRPDDVFELMRRKIKCKYDLDVDYLKLRKQAEANAFGKKQYYTSIHDIYNEIPAVMGISHEMAMELKEMEIQTELDVVIPRREVCEIFNSLVNEGKKVILISDMYLTEDIITRMLNQCGYKGWDKAYISCECGLRKDANTVWQPVVSQFPGQTFIHVGDNPRSDWQVPMDQKIDALWVINPLDALRMYDGYAQIRDLVEHENGYNIEDSILLAMAFHGGLFNSPWSQTPYTGIPEIEHPWDLGFGMFGQLLTNYIRNVSNGTKENKILLFLAREGYLLQKMYQEFNENLGKQEQENYYFQASRRCVTVAAVKDRKDFEEILGQTYRGTLSNLLMTRFGFAMPVDLADRDIELGQHVVPNTAQVMELLEPYLDQIFAQFAVERQAYLSYIHTIVEPDQWKNLEVLDIGYSGTIQYFLSKLLDTKVDGYYLATFATKPDKIGCPFDAVYTEDNPYVEVIQRTQLFLESVLQAPFGQLIKYEDHGKLEAVYKKADRVNGGIHQLQNGMLEYCRRYATIVKDIYDTLENSDETVIRLYDAMLHGKYISENTAGIFGVEDDYCSSKTLKFHRQSDKWI